MTRRCTAVLLPRTPANTSFHISASTRAAATDFGGGSACGLHPSSATAGAQHCHCSQYKAYSSTTCRYVPGPTPWIPTAAQDYRTHTAAAVAALHGRSARQRVHVQRAARAAGVRRRLGAADGGARDDVAGGADELGDGGPARRVAVDEREDGAAVPAEGARDVRARLHVLPRQRQLAGQTPHHLHAQPPLSTPGHAGVLCWGGGVRGGAWGPLRRRRGAAPLPQGTATGCMGGACQKP